MNAKKTKATATMSSGMTWTLVGVVIVLVLVAIYALGGSGGSGIKSQVLPGDNARPLSCTTVDPEGQPWGYIPVGTNEVKGPVHCRGGSGALAYSIARGPAQGTAVVDLAEGDWTYTPAGTGEVFFTVRVVDQRGASASSRITINIIGLSKPVSAEEIRRINAIIDDIFRRLRQSSPASGTGPGKFYKSKIESEPGVTPTPSIAPEPVDSPSPVSR